MRRPMLLMAIAFGALGFLAGRALPQSPAKAPPTVNFAEVVRTTPIDPERGGVLTPVLQGEDGTVNVWQLTGTIPPHYHNAHEEYIVVMEGVGDVRLGDETRPLKVGDIVRVPRKVVHQVTARGDAPFRGVSFFGPAFDGTDRVFLDAE